MKRESGSSCCDAALEYVSLGWSVVPIEPKGKAPLIPWSEYTTRRASREEVEAWFERWPNANIGVITGQISGLVAVDIDPKRGGEVERLLRENPTNSIQRTGSGGWHLLYQYTGPTPNRVGADGVDVRADGGLIVVAPSIHANGEQYTWNNGARGVDLIPRTPAPPWTLPAPQTNHTPSGDHWLTDVLGGVGTGQRNDVCARLAGYYYKRRLPLDVARAMLHNWNDKNNPPLTVREVNTTVESVYRTAERRGPAKADRRAQSSDTKERKDGFRLLEFSDYMRRFGARPVSWLIEDWMPTNTVGLLISPPGAYKTWMLLDLAVSVAGGMPFLDLFPVMDRGPVIIIQQEDYHGQTAERLATIIHQRYKWNIDATSFTMTAPPDIPIWVHPDRELRFEDAEVMADLHAVIEALRPKLVIIDPLYSAASVENYMAEAAGQMLALKDWRDDYGTSFLIAHHTRKSSEGSNREQAWGSQFLNAWLETGWQIRPNSETSVTLRRHFKMSKPVAPLRAVFGIVTGSDSEYSITVEEIQDEQEGSTADRIIDALADAKQGTTAADLGRTLGVHRTTVSRQLKNLQKEGRVIKSGDKWKLSAEQTGMDF